MDFIEVFVASVAAVIIKPLKEEENIKAETKSGPTARVFDESGLAMVFHIKFLPKKAGNIEAGAKSVHGE